MLKSIKLREEDYWLIPVSIVATFFIGLCLYVGPLPLRFGSGLIGAVGLIFTYQIIKRGYSTNRAYMHVFICLVTAIVLSAGFYFLTN